jgi:hypothetical protein
MSSSENHRNCASILFQAVRAHNAIGCVSAVVSESSWIVQLGRLVATNGGHFLAQPIA